MKSDHPLDKITEEDMQIVRVLRATRAIRPDVLKFAYAMEMTLRKHDAKKGDSWKSCEISFLEQKLDEEYKEYVNESAKFYHWEPVSETAAFELIDIANMAMMLWHRKDDTT